METCSALLTLCKGNSPVTGEFPAHRPLMRNFDVFFDLRLDKRLSKQSWGWWFETPSRPLWRHSNEFFLRTIAFDLRWYINRYVRLDAIHIFDHIAAKAEPNVIGYFWHIPCTQQLQFHLHHNKNILWITAPVIRNAVNRSIDETKSNRICLWIQK